MDQDCFGRGRARTYLWNNLSPQKDSNSSTAVLDAVVDASHVDYGFQPVNVAADSVGECRARFLISLIPYFVASKGIMM